MLSFEPFFAFYKAKNGSNSAQLNKGMYCPVYTPQPSFNSRHPDHKSRSGTLPNHNHSNQVKNTFSIKLPISMRIDKPTCINLTKRVTLYHSISAMLLYKIKAIQNNSFPASQVRSLHTKTFFKRISTSSITKKLRTAVKKVNVSGLHVERLPKNCQSTVFSCAYRIAQLVRWRTRIRWIQHR